MSNEAYASKLPKTSTEIISEAKAALNPSLYVKPLSTNRPFTPRERVFFCPRRSNRPPSAFKYAKNGFKMVNVTIIMCFCVCLCVYMCMWTHIIIGFNLCSSNRKRKRVRAQNYRLSTNQNIKFAAAVIVRLY